MSKMSGVALQLDEISYHIGNNTWTLEETMAAMKELLDLGFEEEVREAFNRGLVEWHAAGMPRYPEVRSEVPLR
jgi:hypothetical protein